MVDDECDVEDGGCGGKGEEDGVGDSAEQVGGGGVVLLEVGDEQVESGVAKHEADVDRLGCQCQNIAYTQLDALYLEVFCFLLVEQVALHQRIHQHRVDILWPQEYLVLQLFPHCQS